MPADWTDIQDGDLATPASVNDRLDSIRKGQVHDVRAYGATGDGSTDDTDAIKSAVSQVVNNGGSVYFPPGDYSVTSTIFIDNAENIRLFGAGWESKIQPSSDLGGESVIQFNDSRFIKVSDLQVEGNSGAPPNAGFRSDVVDPSVDGFAARQIVLEDVRIGGNASNSMEYGFRITATGNDQNNEQHTFRGVVMTNQSVANITVEHSNSLWHKIYGGSLGDASSCVSTDGGSFQMYGTALSATDTYFRFSGLQRKEILIDGVRAESAATFLHSDASFVPNVRVANTHTAASPSGTSQILFEPGLISGDRQGEISFVNTLLNGGQADTSLVLSRKNVGSSQPPRASFLNCQIGATRFHYEGDWLDIGCQWQSGAVAESSDVSGQLVRLGSRSRTDADPIFRRLRLGQKTTPGGTSSAATGDIVWDDNYMYVATSEDSWSRATLNTF